MAPSHWIVTPTTRTRLVVLGAFIALDALLIANWWFVWVRFGSPRLSYVFMALVFASPVIPCWLVWTSKSRLFRVVGASVVFPLSVVSGALFLGLVFLAFPSVLVSDIDYSFERLRRQRVANEWFAVYRTNAGATTSFGIVVRKEQTILPGLYWVQVMCTCYPADDVILTRVDARTIRCEFPGYGIKRPNIQRIDVFNRSR